VDYVVCAYYSMGVNERNPMMATKNETRTEWVVSFVEEDGSETAFAIHEMRRDAEVTFEAAKTAPQRKGRGLMLSKDTYGRDECGDVVLISAEQIDGMGGDNW
jgi:hypothetical protein